LRACRDVPRCGDVTREGEERMRLGRNLRAAAVAGIVGAALFPMAGTSSATAAGGGCSPTIVQSLPPGFNPLTATDAQLEAVDARLFRLPWRVTRASRRPRLIRSASGEQQRRSPGFSGLDSFAAGRIGDSPAMCPSPRVATRSASVRKRATRPGLRGSERTLHGPALIDIAYAAHGTAYNACRSASGAWSSPDAAMPRDRFGP